MLKSDTPATVDLGSRATLKLIVHPDGTGPGTIEITGRVTALYNLQRRDLAHALLDIETIVNERLPHLRLHISLEGRE